MKFYGATLERSTDMMGKMDPFVQVDFTRGTAPVKKFKGPTHKGGHKAPQWNWETEYYYGGEVGGPTNEAIKISVHEEDVTSNDLVGETAAIPLSTLVG